MSQDAPIVVDDSGSDDDMGFRPCRNPDHNERKNHHPMSDEDLDATPPLAQPNPPTSPRLRAGQQLARRTLHKPKPRSRRSTEDSESEEPRGDDPSDEGGDRKKRRDARSRHFLITAFPAATDSLLDESNIPNASEPSEGEDRAAYHYALWSGAFNGGQGIESLIPSVIRYLIVGFETCPETGRKHYQCYLEMSAELGKKWSFGMIKKLCGDPTMHIEARKGSRDEARNYSTKETFIEYGRWISGAGYRTDVHDLAEMVQEGKTLNQIATQAPASFMRMHKGVVALKAALFPPKLRPQPEVTVIYGDSGTGKSHAVRQATAGEDVYYKPKGMWWDGYDHQTIVCFDDFEGTSESYNFAELLNVLDKAPMAVPVKGGFVALYAHRFYFTSNIPPQQWYPAAQYPYNTGQLARRVTEIIALHKAAPQNNGGWKETTHFSVDDDYNMTEFDLSIGSY